MTEGERLNKATDKRQDERQDERQRGKVPWNKQEEQTGGNSLAAVDARRRPGTETNPPSPFRTMTTQTRWIRWIESTPCHRID